MAEFEFLITHQDVGSVIPIENGFLQSFEMTKPPTTRFETPAPKVDGGGWASGYFSLKGERNRGNILSLDLTNPLRRAIALNFNYSGQLVISAVPHGTTWRVIVSDTKIIRKAA
jgi:hypothetical protein